MKHSDHSVFSSSFNILFYSHSTNNHSNKVHVFNHHSRSIKSFNIVSFHCSLTHSILYHSNIRKVIQYYVIQHSLRSYDLYHSIYRISVIQFHSLNVYHSLLCHMCHLLSFNVLSYSTCFIQTCYFKNISQSFIFIQHTIIVNLPHSTF